MFEYDKDALDSDEADEFVVGLGCFWGIEAKFGSVEGVVRSSCGYSGGSKNNPKYRSIKDHTETVRVEYDPEIITYNELVHIGINAHNPRSKNRKRQYDNVIFYKNEKQKEIVKDAFRNEGYSVANIETRIEKLDKYYYAEDYHQKYKLRSRRSLEDQFTNVYNEQQFRNSALATKMNSVVAGELKKSEFSVPDEFDMEEDIFDRIAKRFR